MDRDVVQFLINLLDNAEYHPRGEQLADLLSLHTRSKEQLLAQLTVEEAPKADVKPLAAARRPARAKS